MISLSFYLTSLGCSDRDIIYIDMQFSEFSQRVKEVHQIEEEKSLSQLKANGQLKSWITC